MQQAQRVETTVEQCQGVIGRTVGQLFSQFHFIAVLARKGTADQQVAGQRL